MIVTLPRAAAKQPMPYNGFDIILTENFKFAVVFEDEQYPIYCESLDAAHRRIDDYHKRKAKQNKAKETCKLPFAAMSQDNRLVTGIVKGLHSSQGYVLTNTGELTANVWYPDTPMIRRELEELGELRTKARAIEQRLNPFKMMTKPVYGRTSAERYDEVLAGIVKDYEVKKAKAHAASLKVA